MRITLKEAKEASYLPGAYYKIAEISYPISMGKWITVARFISDTHGAVPVHFKKYEYGLSTVHEISFEEYKMHVISSVGG